MGRYFVITEVSPDLKTGVTRAIFIFSGKVQLLRDNSKMYFNATNKELKFCFTMSQFISSKPGHLPPFKEKNAIFISSSDKVTYSKELSDPLRYISNDLCNCGFHMLISVQHWQNIHWSYWQWFFDQKYFYCWEWDVLVVSYWQVCLCQSLPS